jgi:maleylacetoacetate isomerase
MTATYVLHQAQRSSASWRVRWGLELKGISYETVWIDLLRREQATATFAALNPMRQVPVLVVDGKPLAESLAILEWLDETVPEPPLLPRDPWRRARARQLALLVACGIQPLQGLSVLQYHSDDEGARAEYARHWIGIGLGNYEALVRETAGRFSVGDALSLADLCLVPQVWNARRFGMALETWPTVRGIFERCFETAACRATEPRSP